jgi:signal transduction histidine kinase
VRSIRENADRLKALFDKAILLSGFRMGECDLATELVDLLKLARYCAEGAQAKAASRRVRIRTEGVGRTVGDTRYLRIAIEALVDNAVRFSPEGGQVELVVSEDRDCSWLRVIDHGGGIPAAALPCLFDELNPGDIAHHTEGQKLSLAIGRAIIRRHGGDIDVTSSPGAGTAFTVRLPHPTAPSAPSR